VENAGPESRGTGSRVAENAGSGEKGGVWKTRSLVENAGSSGKRRVSLYFARYISLFLFFSLH